MTDNELIRKEILYTNEKLRTEWFETPDGKKHGVQKDYYPNGNLFREEPYEQGQKHGVHKCYFQNGDLFHEYPYEQGKLHGIAKDYHKNGNLFREQPYEQGQKHGVAKKYHPNGDLAREEPYEQGQKHGVHKCYFQNGRSYEVHYVKGRKITPEIFAEYQAQKAAMFEKTATQQQPQSKPKPN